MDINLGKMLLYFVLDVLVCIRGITVCSFKPQLAHIRQSFELDGCCSGIPNECNEYIIIICGRSICITFFTLFEYCVGGMLRLKNVAVLK